MMRFANNRYAFPLTFALISLLAFLLRVVNVGRESLWYDEAVSFLTAELPLRSILANVIRDPHPPFSYALLYFWFKLLPPGDVDGRLLSLLLNMITLSLVYVLAKLLLRKRSLALFAVFLAAVSPFHILYSHELRMYTLVMALSAALGIAYVYAERTDARRWWLAFAVLSLLMVYTHLFSLFVLAAVGVYALIRRRHGALLWKTAAVGFIIFLLFLPWLYLLFGQAQADMESLRPLASDETFNPLKPLTSLAFLLFGQAHTLWYSAAVFFLVIASLVVLLLELRKAAAPERQPLLLPGLIVLLTVGGPSLVYFVRPFFLPERTMAAAAPYLLILLAWGLTRKRSPLPFLAGGAAVVMITGTAVYHTGGLIKPPYRDAIQYVARQYEEGDVVLHTSDGSYLPALSYVDLPNQALLAGDPDMRKPTAVYEAYGGQVWRKEEAALAGDRLWLIVALEHSIEWQQEQAAYFEQRYPLLTKQEIGGVIVYLYDINTTSSRHANGY